MLQAMELMQHNTQNYYLNGEKRSEIRYVDGERQYRVEGTCSDIDFIRYTFEKYNRILPPRITAYYMFRIFYLRSVIDSALVHNDFLFSKSEEARNALLELEAIYHTSSKSNEYLRPPVNDLVCMK